MLELHNKIVTSFIPTLLCFLIHFVALSNDVVWFKGGGDLKQTSIVSLYSLWHKERWYCRTDFGRCFTERRKYNWAFCFHRQCKLKEHTRCRDRCYRSMAGDDVQTRCSNLFIWFGLSLGLVNGQHLYEDVITLNTEEVTKSHWCP